VAELIEMMKEMEESPQLKNLLMSNISTICELLKDPVLNKESSRLLEVMTSITLHADVNQKDDVILQAITSFAKKVSHFFLSFFFFSFFSLTSSFFFPSFSTRTGPHMVEF
jgi:hypothetical protein